MGMNACKRCGKIPTIKRRPFKEGLWPKEEVINLYVLHCDTEGCTHSDPIVTLVYEDEEDAIEDWNRSNAFEKEEKV